MSRVLGDDHYIRMPRVTVGLALLGTHHCAMAMGTGHR